jgi:hypothetical protein
VVDQRRAAGLGLPVVQRFGQRLCAIGIHGRLDLAVALRGDALGLGLFTI